MHAITHIEQRGRLLTITIITLSKNMFNTNQSVEHLTAEN